MLCVKVFSCVCVEFFSSCLFTDILSCVCVWVWVCLCACVFSLSFIKRIEFLISRKRVVSILSSSSLLSSLFTPVTSLYLNSGESTSGTHGHYVIIMILRPSTQKQSYIQAQTPSISSHHHHDRSCNQARNQARHFVVATVITIPAPLLLLQQYKDDSHTVLLTEFSMNGSNEQRREGNKNDKRKEGMKEGENNRGMRQEVLTLFQYHHFTPPKSSSSGFSSSTG